MSAGAPIFTVCTKWLILTVLVQVFRAHDVITERAKVTLEKMPWWVKVLDAPGHYGDMVQKKIAAVLRACTGRQVPSFTCSPLSCCLQTP